MRLQTRTIHTGVDKDIAYNSIMTPIYQTSTFRFADIGITRGYDYTRTSNPTRKESLIRLSVGLEDIKDILDDLSKALSTIPKNIG
jgi:cystathionine beta-lyase/cystathionine gamma-synthase